MAMIKVKAIDSFHLNGVGQISARQVIALPETVVKELVLKKLVLVQKGSSVDPKKVTRAPENKMKKAAPANKGGRKKKDA